MLLVQGSLLWLPDQFWFPIAPLPLIPQRWWHLYLWDALTNAYLHPPAMGSPRTGLHTMCLAHSRGSLNTCRIRNVSDWTISKSILEAEKSSDVVGVGWGGKKSVRGRYDRREGYFFVFLSEETEIFRKWRSNPKQTTPSPKLKPFRITGKGSSMHVNRPREHYWVTGENINLCL